MGMSLGLLVLRVVIGLTLAAHGAQKAFGWWSGPGPHGWRSGMERMGMRPSPLWAVLSTAAELVGGLLLALGLLTPFAVAVLVAQSLVIIFHVHWPRGFFSQGGGFEYPLAILATVVAIAGTGPGSYSLDSALHLAYSDSLRIALLVIGVIAGLVALAVPRVSSQQAQPSGAR